MENRYKKDNLINIELGKLPPQALDLEEAVLGACLIETEAVTKMLSVVSSREVFYKEAHRLIFEAIQRLSNAGNPVDMLTVTNELTTMGALEMVGGGFAIVSITNKVNSAANIEYHLHILFERYLKRRMIELSMLVMQESYTDTTDVFDLMDNAQLAMDSIKNSYVTHSAFSGTDVVKSTLEMLERAMNQTGLMGITTGLKSLDQIFGGWKSPDLIIGAGRPGMGKTGIVLGLLRNAYLAGHPVGVFSLEMSSEQLMLRLICAELYLTFNMVLTTFELANGKFTHEQFTFINKAIGVFTGNKIQVVDTPGMSLKDLRSKAIEMVTKHRIELIVVDYLQLLKGEGHTREQEISYIARGLKNLAKELKVPVIALSQLSRAVETRGGEKKPQLSDLRESGEIEQAADIIFFFYRPEYYGIMEDENGMPTQDVCEILVRKHRNGPSPLDIPIVYKAMVSVIKDSPFFSADPSPLPTSKRIEPTKEQSSNSMPVGRNFYEKEPEKEPPF